MTKRLISFLIALCIFIAIPLSARYKYNPFTRKLDYYEPVSGSDLGDLGDVTLTGLATGNVLYYNGTAWVNLATGSNGEVLTLAAGLPSWAVAAATFLALTDTPANYVGSGSYMVRVNAGANALVFGAESAIDHDGLTNWVGNKHIDWTAAASDFSTSEDFTLTWADAADHMVITQSSEDGIETQSLIYINDGRFGATANEKDEATLRLKSDAGTVWGLWVEVGKAEFDGNILWSWTEAADNAAITQTAVAGIEDVPLILIDDDRTGVTADEYGEASWVINAAGAYALYVQNGAVQLDGVFTVADNPIRENLLSNSGFGVWSQSDANKGLATITYDTGTAGGGSAPGVGDAVVGGTSGAVAKVISYTIATGAFATNDATGVVTVGAVSSDFAFVNNETITFGGVETAAINMSDGAVQVGKVQNGGFATDTDPPPGWTATAATLTTEAGGLIGNCMKVLDDGPAGGLGSQIATTVVGKIYKFTVWAKDIDTGQNGRIEIGTALGGAQYYTSGTITDDAGTTYTGALEATTTTTYVSLTALTAGGTYYFDEVTLYEITPSCTAADILACDMWEKNTAGHIYREHDGTNTKDGSFYSAKMVPNAGGFYVLFPKTYYSDEYHLKHFAGRTVTFGVWVKTSAASHAYLRAYDGVTSTNGDYHTGGGDFEWLEITKAISAAASNVHFQVRSDLTGNVDGSTIVYISQPMLVYGSAIGEGNYQKKSQEFIWLDKAIPSNAYDGLLTQSDLAYTDLNLEADSDAMLPKGARVIAIHTEIDDAASGGGSDVHLQLRKDATAGTFYCNSVAGKPNNVHAHAMGLQPCGMNGDVDIHLDASGASTLDVNVFEYHGVQIN